MDNDIEIFRSQVRLTPMELLLWGPGKPKRGTPPEERKGWNKRLQIRRQIRKKFPNAKVHFSEDKDFTGSTSWLDDQMVAEATQAYSVDGIIILAISRGSQLELDNYIEFYSWIRGKAYVLLPEQYINSGGLVDVVLDKLPPKHIIGFSQKEFDECSVAREKAIHIVDQIATAKFLRLVK